MKSRKTHIKCGACVDHLVHHIIFHSLQDLPLGLMDDIYEWCKNFSIRIDEMEEVGDDVMLMVPPLSQVGMKHSKECSANR